MYQNLNAAPETVATAYSLGTSPINVKNAQAYGITLAVTNSAPAAGVFTVVAATDVVTKAAHGFLTGLVVRLTTATLLPGGLALATDYYVIRIDANTFYFATTLVNALANTRVDITDTGTGAHTVTPTALAGASVKLQGCNEDEITSASVFFDIPIEASGDVSKSATITVSSNVFLYDKFPAINFIKAQFTLTTGQLSTVCKAVSKGVN